MVVRDFEDREHPARIEAGIIVVEGRLMTPDDFLMSNLEVVSFDPTEEKELQRWGVAQKIAKVAKQKRRL